MLDNDLLSTEGKSEMELQLIQPMLIHLLGYMAEKERTKILQRQREGIDAMMVDDKGKKVSKKTGRVTGRPSKQEALTKSQKVLIKGWINKKIKLAEVKRETGLSQATLYRIKENWKKDESC